MLDSDLYLPTIWHLPCLFVYTDYFSYRWMISINYLNTRFQDFILEWTLIPPFPYGIKSDLKIMIGTETQAS